MTNQTITESFKTKSGLTVIITGTLTGKEIKMDITVQGYGRQGSFPALSNFTNNGIDYVAIVGKLPLTQEQMDIYNKVYQPLLKAKNEYEKAIGEDVYGTYEEVQVRHPWMKNTY